MQKNFRVKTAISFIISFLALGYIHEILSEPAVWIALGIDGVCYFFANFLGEHTRKAQSKRELLVALGLDIAVLVLISSVIIQTLLLFMGYETSSKEVQLSLFIIALHSLYAILPDFSKGTERYYEMRHGEPTPRESYSPPLGCPEHKEDKADNFTPVLAIAEGTCDLFVSKGLERFLLKDYIESGIFFSSWNLFDKEETQNKLYIEILDMMSFLELPLFSRLVVEYSSSDSSTEAGSYQSNLAYDRVIKINIKPYYDPYHVFAILCHECTHYFMEYHKLNWEDTELNEQRTDVIANLIGFNKAMLRGYREILIRQIGNTRTTHKIGYITDRDCIDLAKFLKQRRKQIMKDKNNEERFSELKRDIEKYIETAKILSQQLKFFDLKKLKADTPECFTKFQKVIMEMEVRNIPAEISKYEHQLNKKMNFTELEKIKVLLESLCTDLVQWQVLLSREN